MRDLLFPLHCSIGTTPLNTVKREGEPESATYFHFRGTVIQWKIHTAVDRTEYVSPSVQEYLLTSLIQSLFDILGSRTQEKNLWI